MNVKRQPVVLDGRFATIPLSRGLFAIVDVHLYDELSRYRWRVFRSSYCIYAARRVRRNGHEYLIYMHRVIAKTPSGFECHHINRYTLDCREQNLENKTKPAHAAEHGRSVV